MERSDGDENESCSTPQNTLWKQFQAKAKPLLSPKLGAREPDDKKEKGMWMFKKMKRKESVMDRVISSSQPDLLFSSPLDVEAKEAQLCGKTALQSSSSSKQKTASPIKHTVAQLVQSHHKSSSLGSACLERLAEAPSSSSSGGEEAATSAPQLETEDEQPVSSVWWWFGF